MSLIPYRYNHLSRPERDFMSDFFRPFFGSNAFPSAFNVDVRDDNDKYVLEADLPGVERDDLNIDINDGVLTISAEWNNEKKDEKKNGYIVNERRYGKASRSFSLENINEDGISAKFENGVLKLTMPKIEKTANQPKRIEIQ